MRRAWLMVLVALGISGLVGCTMCAHPYDYCGPTSNGQGDCCDPMGRAGSILSPSMGTTAVASTSAETPVRPPSRVLPNDSGPPMPGLPDEPTPTPGTRSARSGWRSAPPER